MKVPEGSARFRAVPVQMPGQGSAGGGSGGGRSASPRKENNQLQLSRPPQAGERQGGGLRGPRRRSVKGGALGAEEGEAGAGLG